MSAGPSAPPLPDRGPILLALSTFRQSETAVERALQLAREMDERLVALHVVDVNLARYFVGQGVLSGTEFRDMVEEDMLRRHETEGQARNEAIAARARAAGVPVELHLQRGRYAAVCLDLVNNVRPRVIILTRSKRPAVMRRFFGSPVDEVLRRAPCPVEEW